MGGREKYIVSELNRRGIKIEQKGVVDKTGSTRDDQRTEALSRVRCRGAKANNVNMLQNARQSTLRTGRRKKLFAPELKTLTWAAYKATHISHWGMAFIGMMS